MLSSSFGLFFVLVLLTVLLPEFNLIEIGAILPESCQPLMFAIRGARAGGTPEYARQRAD